MDPRTEMAAIVTSLLRELIEPVQILSLSSDKASGAVSGRFRSGNLLFDYKLPGDGTISYAPLRGSTEEMRGDAIEQRRHATAMVDPAEPTAIDAAEARIARLGGDGRTDAADREVDAIDWLATFTGWPRAASSPTWLPTTEPPTAKRAPNTEPPHHDPGLKATSGTSPQCPRAWGAARGGGHRRGGGREREQRSDQPA